MKQHQQTKTKDEQFLIRLYQEALKQEEMDHPFDRYEIGKMVGLQARAVNAICALLFKTNFIKKIDDTMVYITPHGIKLALTILD